MSIENVKKAISLIKQHEDDADFDGSKDESLINLAERTLGLEFPASYRFFLENLGCGDIAGQEFFGVIKPDFTNSGIPDAIWLTIKERQQSDLPRNYVIVHATGDGDYVVLDCNKTSDSLNKVQLWSPGVKEHQLALKPYFDDFGDFFYEQVLVAVN